MTIKPGDVVFVMHHDNKLSRVIAWFMSLTRPKTAPIFSHTAASIGGDDARHYLSETSDYEITLGWLERYLDDPHCSVEVWTNDGLTDEDRKVAVEDWLSRTGRLYPYLQLLSFALRALLALVHIAIPNLIRWNWVCDQHVLAGLVRCPRSGFLGVDEKSIQTLEFYDALVSSGRWRRVLKKDGA